MSTPRAALEAIGQLPDAEIDIADAALHLAAIDMPGADIAGARIVLSEIARDAVALRPRAEAERCSKRAMALAELLAGRYGFCGDHESYDDPANANLLQVIARRRGLPVALGIVWLHAAHAAGWDAHGIDFPAHFLIGLSGRGAPVPIDVFDGGQALDAAALHRLLVRIEGPEAVLRPDLLRPMSRREVLLRLQNNLLVRRGQGGDLAGALACAEDMLRIAPGHADLWWQAAAMNRRLERHGAALDCFERYLTLVPEGSAASRARAAISALRGRLN